MYEDIFGSIRKAAEKRNLRERTIQLYCSNIRYFLRCTNKPVTDLTLEDADIFLTMKRLEGRSPETHNHYRSSIKFLYKRVLKIAWDDEEVPAMKRGRNLPTVLTPQEINAAIEATDNLKHKAIIATMYSSGLRVSEVVHLHYDDVSRTNMTIHVREAKGRIDRYTILSQRNLDLLTEYWFQCGRPKGILFPSSWTGGYLDISSVNQFFKASAKKAGITRRVSSHACRHSFASHLFESGVDIKYIQSLLGHVDPRSTDVYLHVSNKTLPGIRSPFDTPKGGEPWAKTTLYRMCLITFILAMGKLMNCLQRSGKQLITS